MMNIQLRFLLAYSPFLNPIEKMFSVLKKELQGDSICNRIATVPALISVVEHRIREFLYKHSSFEKNWYTNLDVNFAFWFSYLRNCIRYLKPER